MKTSKLSSRNPKSETRNLNPENRVAEVDLSEFVANVWEDVRVILSSPEDAGDQV